MGCEPWEMAPGSWGFYLPTAVSQLRDALQVVTLRVLWRPAFLGPFLFPFILLPGALQLLAS